jgi:hypothetical protein
MKKQRITQVVEYGVAFVIDVVTIANEDTKKEPNLLSLGEGGELLIVCKVASKDVAKIVVRCV